MSAQRRVKLHSEGVGRECTHVDGVVQLLLHPTCPLTGSKIQKLASSHQPANIPGKSYVSLRTKTTSNSFLPYFLASTKPVLPCTTVFYIPPLWLNACLSNGTATFDKDIGSRVTQASCLTISPSTPGHWWVNRNLMIYQAQHVTQHCHLAVCLRPEHGWYECATAY